MQSDASGASVSSSTNGSNPAESSSSAVVADLPSARKSEASIPELGDEMVSGFVLVQRLQRLRRIVIGVVAAACGLIVLAAVLHLFRRADGQAKVPAPLPMADAIQENGANGYPAPIATSPTEATANVDTGAANDTPGSSAKTSPSGAKTRRPKSPPASKARNTQR
ncbi:MAG TPA: hypothetical protein VF881_16995 [Polyangiaceae bacterium]